MREKGKSMDGIALAIAVVLLSVAYYWYRQSEDTDYKTTIRMTEDLTVTIKETNLKLQEVINKQASYTGVSNDMNHRLKVVEDQILTERRPLNLVMKEPVQVKVVYKQVPLPPPPVPMMKPKSPLLEKAGIVKGN